MVAMFAQGNHDKTFGERYPESSLFPVRSAKELLAGPTHKKILEDIRAAAPMAEDSYNELYLGLIHNFAEFVQILPVSLKQRSGGMLNEGLHRALAMLKRCDSAGIPKDDELMIYAVFSVGLLLDVGKIQLERKIIISKKDGAYVREWSPYMGAMEKGDGHFKIRYCDGVPSQLAPRLTPIFAQQLMPRRGFLWLAEYPEVLVMWLAALARADDASGMLGDAIAMVLKNYLEEIKRLHALAAVDAKATHPEDLKAGETFVKWLKEQLDKGKIKVNEENSAVHVTKAGVVVDVDKVHEDFKRAFSKYRDKVVLMQQCNRLGIAKKSGGDYKFQQTFSDRPEVAANKANKTRFGSLFQQKQQHTKTQNVKKNTGLKQLGKFAVPEKGKGEGNKLMIRDGSMLLSKGKSEFSKHLNAEAPGRRFSEFVKTTQAKLGAFFTGGR